MITDLKAIISMLNIDKRQHYTCSVIYLFFCLLSPLLDLYFKMYGFSINGKHSLQILIPPNISRQRTF